MVQAMDGEPDLERTLSDEVYTFVVAGEETTSNLFVALMFMLFEHPETLARLRAEINEHIKEESDITGENLKKLEYLQMAMKEALRLRGPTIFIFDRYASQNMSIGDIPVAKGTMMNYNYKSSMFKPENFDAPLEFRPERWEDDRYKTAEMQAMTEMNFSGGPRVCIGKHLAYLEVKIAVVKFLRRYDNMKELKERVFGIGLISKFEHSVVEVTSLS